MKKPNPTTADEQREHIAKLMMEREWHPGRCHKELAELWGIGVRTVAQRALEASRAIQLAGKVKDQVDAAIQELDSLQAMAIAEVKATSDGGVMPMPNVRAAVECIKLKMQLLGAMHGSKPVIPEAAEASMSDAELIAKAESLLDRARGDLEKRH